MKTIILTLATLLGTAFMGFSQSKSSIAAGNPAVNGLHVTPEIASKLIRLELIKIDEYAVYDEYDMQDIYDKDETLKTNCLSKTCLAKLGTELGVDYVVSGSFDALGNKIVISLKIIDVKNNSIFKSSVREFDNQEVELQRMTEIVLKEMHGIAIEKEIVDRLKFNNEVISSNNVGKINNSGPRIGYAAMTGSFYEFANRSEDQGGLDIFPAVSMIGYQIEGQYVGTENFSALVEGIINFSGLEQGQFLPTISLMNGFRFGKAGWEFAFGPGFGLTRESNGFFDTQGIFGDKDAYFSSNGANNWYEFRDREFNNEAAYPEYFTSGNYVAPEIEEFGYDFAGKEMDKLGRTKISTQFVFAFGRTFKAGALNIPVNVFYSSKKGGGTAGVSVGFNVMKSKKSINPKRAI
ncbi:MAG: hypothetical protein ACJASQ_003874 [Crocinitomicaceae bacterium]|jgi:hypothetical protein